MERPKKEIYFNVPQRLTQLIGAHTTVIVAGRRTGKTDSIASPFVLRNMQRMPGSTGGIVVPTYKHGLTNTIPGLLAAWKRWGYINGIHYVIGRKPPKAFGKPIIEPAEYEHVISFYNGSCAIIISQDRRFLHYEDKMDVELIETIKGTIYEIWHVKQRVRSMQERGIKVPRYLRTYLRRLDTDLNKMRSVAVYYKEYSTIENLQLLGESYIKQMKRDLTPKTFQTSILCKRIGIAKDGFYSSMREGHKYNASDFNYLDSLGYDFNDTQLDSRADKDLNPFAPICIGMDYNANINWIVAGQPSGRRLNVIKSFYTKFERKIPALIDDFCRYYMHHECKVVVYYYDSTALGGNYAVNEQDFHWVVCHEFERHGWQVEDINLGNPMRHDEKYLLINQGFAGKQRLMPMFNRQNNDDLILAIQTAGVVRGRNGFRKDKGGEKLAETEEDLLQHRTDGTDAFDTLYIGCEKFPYRDTFGINSSGVL